MTGDLLRIVGVAELGALSAMLVVFFAHSLWMALMTRRSQRRLEELRQDMVRCVGREGRVACPTSSKDSRLYHLALEEVASSVSGNGATWIEQAARDTGLFDQAARWCRSRRWWHRLRGVRLFGLVGGGGDLVPGCLGDAHPLVREAAVRWVVRHPSRALAEDVLVMLEDPERRCRLAAQDTLIRIRATAAEALAAFLARGSCRGWALALEVASGIADARFLGPGLRAAADSDPAVRAQAAGLLAAVAGSEAEQALLGLLHDPSDPVRVAATRGLGVVSSWALAPDLSGQLSDPARDVRREAALALRRLGPAGRLYLRRALVSNDPYAADMAHHVLDLPGTTAG
jgi:hypothetical protein